MPRLRNRKSILVDIPAALRADFDAWAAGHGRRVEGPVAHFPPIFVLSPVTRPDPDRSRDTIYR